MSGQNIALALEERAVQGKAVRQLRRDGLVPAVIHDHGKPSKVVMAPYLALAKAYKDAGKHHPLQLTVGDQSYMAMIKDIRFDPKKNLLQHVVFNAIKQDEKVETEVPIRIEGEIPAEKVGLVLMPAIDHITIEALPRDLIDEVKISGENLAEIGDKLSVADLVIPEGVTLLTDPDQTIAVVEEPRVQEVEEPEPEEGAEGEEGEEGAEGEGGEGGSASGESAEGGDAKPEAKEE